VSSPRRIAALAAVLALAAPAGAWAQGAGDTQYEDPFAGENGGNGGGGSGSGSGAGSGANPKLSSTMPGSQGGAEGSQRLPRTGADPGLVALLGAGFLLTGAGLRVRVRRPVG
jgi:hypothetical protein